MLSLSQATAKIPEVEELLKSRFDGRDSRNVLRALLRGHPAGVEPLPNYAPNGSTSSITAESPLLKRVRDGVRIAVVTHPEHRVVAASIITTHHVAGAAGHSADEPAAAHADGGEMRRCAGFELKGRRVSVWFEGWLEGWFRGTIEDFDPNPKGFEPLRHHIAFGMSHCQLEPQGQADPEPWPAPHTSAYAREQTTAKSDGSISSTRRRRSA